MPETTGGAVANNVGIQGIGLAKNLDGRLEMATLAINWDTEWAQVWRRWEPLEGGWTRWQPFGEPGAYRIGPAFAMNRDGRLEAAMVSNDEAVWHAWQRHPGRAWTEWQTLGTPIPEGGPGPRFLAEGGPVLARNQDGRLEVFVDGRSSDQPDISVWHCWQSAAGTGPWSAWSDLGHPPEFGIQEIAVAQNHDGRLELFAMADNGVFPTVWHIWQSAPRADASWSSWQELKTPRELSGGPGQGLGSKPAVARNQDGRLELFMRGSDLNVWHCWQSAAGAGPWSPWHSLGRPVNGRADLAAGAQADGRLVVFAANTRSPELALLEQTAPNDGWSSWRPFEPRVRLDNLTVALDADRRLELWARVPGSVDPFFLRQVSPNSSDWDGGVYEAAPQPGSTGSEPPAYVPTPAGSEEAPPG
jgi:hypothetical protein